MIILNLIIQVNEDKRDKDNNDNTITIIVIIIILLDKKQQVDNLNNIIDYIHWLILLILLLFLDAFAPSPKPSKSGSTEKATKPFPESPNSRAQVRIKCLFFFYDH